MNTFRSTWRPSTSFITCRRKKTKIQMTNRSMKSWKRFSIRRNLFCARWSSLSTLLRTETATHYSSSQSERWGRKSIWRGVIKPLLTILSRSRGSRNTSTGCMRTSRTSIQRRICRRSRWSRVEWQPRGSLIRSESARQLSHRWQRRPTSCGRRDKSDQKALDRRSFQVTRSTFESISLYSK